MYDPNHARVRVRERPVPPRGTLLLLRDARRLPLEAEALPNVLAVGSGRTVLGELLPGERVSLSGSGPAAFEVATPLAVAAIALWLAALALFAGADQGALKGKSGLQAVSDFLEANVPEGPTVFALPPSHRRRPRTSRLRARA